MKLAHAALLTGLTTAVLFGTALEVSAQFQLGVQGSLADVRGVAAGLGGRLGYFQPPTVGGTQIGIEGMYSIFFPDCIGLECDSSGGHIALLAGQSVGFGGGAQTYAGLGARYQKVTLDNGLESADGDFWGFMLLVGTRVSTDSPVSPFFELAWSFMSDIPDIWDFTLGARFALGR